MGAVQRGATGLFRALFGMLFFMIFYALSRGVGASGAYFAVFLTG